MTPIARILIFLVSAATAGADALAADVSSSPGGAAGEDCWRVDYRKGWTGAEQDRPVELNPKTANDVTVPVLP